jgi:hypothetical protein
VGDPSLLESPRQNVGTTTRSSISKETTRKRKRRIRRKRMILVIKSSWEDGGDAFVVALTTHASQSMRNMMVGWYTMVMTLFLA